MAAKEDIRKRIVRKHLRMLREHFPERPMTFGYWSTVQSLTRMAFGSNDPLLPPLDKIAGTGVALRTDELRAILAEDQLGAWALDSGSIDFLWKRLMQERPQVIIECGAGVSSVVLTRYAATMPTVAKPMVISFEQDLPYKEGVEKRLSANGLADHSHIFHTPVSAKGEYQFDLDAVTRQLGPVKADWLLIDGPSGPEGCRASTLPELSKLCRPGARWFLDDAFRDGEMRVLREWDAIPGVTVEGIYPIGKGLATGTIDTPERV
jgi:hypothetical protein